MGGNGTTLARERENEFHPHLLATTKSCSSRKSLAVVTLYLLAAIPGILISARASDTDPSVGCWKFDEASGLTAADSSPTGNHGTLQGGVTWATGRIGSALSFDGLTGYVQVGADLNQWLGGTASLSAWIKTTQIGKGDFFRSPGITGVEFAGNNNDIFWGWLDADRTDRPAGRQRGQRPRASTRSTTGSGTTLG